MNTRFSNPVSVCILVFCQIFCLSLLAADPPPATPEGAVSTAVGEMVEILYGENRPEAIEERQVQVKAALEQHFAFDAFVLKSLGRNRGKLTEAELKRVSTLTVDLMVKNYVERFAGAEAPVIEYGKTADLGNHRAELASKVTIDGTSYRILYRVARLETGWKAYDVVIEGASLVGNYRKQFDAHFRKGNGAELIKKLEAEIAK